MLTRAYAEQVIRLCTEKADFAAFQTHTAPGFVYEFMGTQPYAGEWRGTDAVKRQFTAFNDNFTSEFRVTATEIYVDVTTPAVWTSPNEVTMVDLDLDVLRFRPDRSVLIVDQDEFAEHQIRYGYPPDVIAAAEKAADWLHGVLGDGTEPFATDYRGWLAMVS